MPDARLLKYHPHVKVWTLVAYPGHKNIQHTVRYTELAPTRFKAAGEIEVLTGVAVMTLKRTPGGHGCVAICIPRRRSVVPPG
jgi:hypothetical protein